MPQHKNVKGAQPSVIPHAGSKDNAGRPSLPCIMESKSDWESIEL